MSTVLVSGSFDDLRSPQVRLLEEASKLGDLHVLLWSDQATARISGRPAKFPENERVYFLEAIRYVSRITIIDEPSNLTQVPGIDPGNQIITAESFPSEKLKGFPIPSGSTTPTPGKKKVIVTGCYDWLHTGHVRFFEEVSEYGDVYAVVGHDANIELLKGAGHPQFREDERRYMVGALKFVKQALVSTGHGWMDAAPEIERIKPDIYAVNEDGDKPEKKEYCQQHGIEYLLLKRLPKPGLPRRASTDLRGF